MRNKVPDWFILGLLLICTEAMAASTGLDLRKQALEFHHAGQFGKARQLYQQVLQLRQSTAKKKPSLLAESLTDLAQVAIDSGYYGQAEQLLIQAQQLVVNQQNRYLKVQSRINHTLGETWYRQGRYHQALGLFEKALTVRQALFGENHPVIAESLSSLAMVHYAQQNYPPARQLLSYAHSIYTLNKSNATLSDSITLSNLGLVALAQSEYQAATQYLQQALLTQGAILPDSHPAIAATLHNLASVYFEQGLYAQAQGMFQLSLNLAESMSSQFYPSQADSLDMMAELNNRLGRYNLALDYARQATDLYLQRITSNTGRVLLKGDFSEHQSIHHLFEHHLHALLELKKYRNQPDDNRFREELFTVMQLAHISTSGHALLARQQLQQFSKNTGITEPLSLQQTQSHLESGEALLLYFLGWNKSFVMLVSRKQVIYKQLTLNQQNIHQWLDPLMNSLQNAEATRISEIKAFDLFSAYQLYQQLIHPIANELKSSQQLLIIKDLIFDQLPFQLLISRQPKLNIARFTQFSRYRTIEWLIKDFAISELPSVQALSILRTARQLKPRPKKRFVAFGSPSFNQKPRYNISQSTPQNKQSAIPVIEPSKSRYNISQSTPQNAQTVVIRQQQSSFTIDSELLQKLPEISDAASELQQLARLLKAGQGAVYLGQQATETKLKNMRLDEYQILAFATHGLTQQQTAQLNGPAQAALLLTPPPYSSELDDGLLTASEIAQLRLNSDWVILSACNTGVSEAISMDGLARAFFLAGSRSLLVSYWNLESQAASWLTTSLFDQISNQPEISRAEALRQSMLKFLRPGRPTYYSHPYFWAPFAIVGEGGKLAIGRLGH